MSIRNKANVKAVRKVPTRKPKDDGKARLFIGVCKSTLKVEAISEYLFHPSRKWRFDYAIPEHKIAVEVEGATFKKSKFTDKKTGEEITVMGGRHNIGEGYLNDMEKYNEAAILGWRVFRVIPKDLITTKTINMLSRAMG